jgi:hypothetical protein
MEWTVEGLQQPHQQQYLYCCKVQARLGTLAYIGVCRTVWQELQVCAFRRTIV